MGITVLIACSTDIYTWISPVPCAIGTFHNGNELRVNLIQLNSGIFSRLSNGSSNGKQSLNKVAIKLDHSVIEF